MNAIAIHPASVQFHSGETVVGHTSIDFFHGDIAAGAIGIKDLIKMVNDGTSFIILILPDEKAIINEGGDFGAGFTAAGGKTVGTSFGIAVIIAALITGAAGGIHFILSGAGGECEKSEGAENKGDKFFHGKISFCRDTSKITRQEENNKS